MHHLQKLLVLEKNKNVFQNMKNEITFPQLFSSDVVTTILYSMYLLL